MPTGTVKWFDATKGYGFIEPEDGSKDAFVHISAVERAGLGTLREGQKVRYEVQPGRDGKSSAEELSVVDTPLKTALAPNHGPSVQALARCQPTRARPREGSCRP